jgi:hypothetical protein
MPKLLGAQVEKGTVAYHNTRAAKLFGVLLHATMSHIEVSMILIIMPVFNRCSLSSRRVVSLFRLMRQGGQDMRAR